MDIYLGLISQTGFNFSVNQWALCYGQLYSISSNSALFSLLGTQYGGDGRSTFGVPDLRGRAPIGQGQGIGLSYRHVGQRGGLETTVLTQAHLPTHTHTHTYNGGGSQPPAVSITTEVQATTQEATTTTPESGAYLATSKEVGTGGSDYIYVPSSSVDHTKLVSLGGVNSVGSIIGGGSFDNNSFTINNAGGNVSFNNMQPFLVTNYQISLYGIYPSRN